MAVAEEDDVVVGMVATATSLSPAHQGARQMASKGFPVLPLHGVATNGLCTCDNPNCLTPGKHPHHLGSMATATTDLDIIDEWFRKQPALNYGVRLGREVGNTGKMPMVIDVDLYKPGGSEALDALEAVHGRLPDTAEVLSGAGGRHCYFMADCALSFRDDMGDNIDVKVNGYVVGPGSRHAKGTYYDWEGSSSPFEGQEIADLPQWIADKLSKAKSKGSDVGDSASNVPLLEHEVWSIKDDLSYISAACNRKEWLDILMALHDRNQSLSMFKIADGWSQTCPEKYDAAALIKDWKSFKPGGGITYATIQRIAGEERIKGIDISKILENAKRKRDVDAIDAACARQVSEAEPPLLVPRDPAAAKQAPTASVPPHLLTIPGVLGDMVNWVNETSSKPQPYFAVQAALAFASVVMGRKFCTTQRNWTNLYFLNIAVSGGGKEHAKTVIEECLRAAGLQQLIGASEYTSDAAIDSLLLDKPTHISIIDEFGLLLEAGNSKNNHNGGTARKRLMEMFGRSHSTLTPKAYSMAGLGKEMREKQRNRFVENPSLTIVGMTTPDTFYNAVGTGSLKDGFLNRFITAISDLGRQPSQDVNYAEPPESVIQWAKACRIRGAGDIAEIQIDTQHDMRPQPIVVPFDAAATQLFKQLDIQCIERMDELEEQGLSEMYSRVREISMKVSLIVAHSCGSETITAEHAQWAIDYVRYWADRAIVSLAANVADTPFSSLCNQVLNAIKGGGAKGVTVAELARKSSKFKSADSRLRDSVFRNLRSDHGISLFRIPPDGGRGRDRVAYVAPEFADQQH